MELFPLDKVAEVDFETKRNRLKELLASLAATSSFKEKLALLSQVSEVKSPASLPKSLQIFLSGISEESEYVVKVLLAIGQGALFSAAPFSLNSDLHYRRLIDELIQIDRFYRDMGGILGYQYLTLSLLAKKNKKTGNIRFKPPEMIDLKDQQAPSVRRAILEGIWGQRNMAEFYPVGGTADRLNLKEASTRRELPAACLVFQGKLLLESMMYDLQAREYLHYKLFDHQILTPLVLMTSKAKDNHSHIRNICIKHKWFNRPSDSFRFVIQPSVPVFTQEGRWCLANPLELLLKPGGHGVIWKLSKDEGIFDWLRSLCKTKALVRQVNNPMAAIDYGLLAFLGFGHEQNKAFGFASCDRLVHTKEGMIVRKEMDTKDARCAAITNIEYCDFEKYGFEDKPRGKGEPFSRFPSNTNILFADLSSVEEKVKSLPFPGPIVNFRSGVHYSPKGPKKEKLARLETTMQNIADAFLFSAGEQNPMTYVTFGHRHKTISTTKKRKTAEGRMLETPEKCFYDFMNNAKEIFGEGDSAHFDADSCDKKKLPFLINYHPALGPLYSIICQKIRRNRLMQGSELQLEIADVEIENLWLNGSLIVTAEDVMGHKDERGVLHYSSRTGQCILKNVRVENEGMNGKAQRPFVWQRPVGRKASFRLHLKGHSRFEAQNVAFKGNFDIQVENGMHMIASQKGKEICFTQRTLLETDPFWNYAIASDSSIRLIR